MASATGKKVVAIGLAWAIVALPVPVPASTTTPDASAGGAALRVRIRGLASSDGQIKIAIYRSAESYTTRRGSFHKALLPITDQQCEWDLQGLPAGEYAVMFYHDENGNEHLDKNLFGIPTESFGFSNDARPRLGPPPFEQVKFRIGDGLTILDISTQGA
jgi:uncharacterized protein (DUF2141 family)